MTRKPNYFILQQCLLGSNNCLTKREMLPSMHLIETAVNVDVDSVGKAERQTKGIVMCSILWGLISLHRSTVRLNSTWHSHGLLFHIPACQNLSKQLSALRLCDGTS